MSVNTVNASKVHFRFDQRDGEQILDTIASITVDPLKNLAYYAIPFLGTFAAAQFELREDDATQNGFLPPHARKDLFKEISLLKKGAGITREIGIYSSLTHATTSYGGAFSLTKPAIAIPHQYIVRPNGEHFGSEKPDSNLKNDIWKFTDDETRFIISREMAQVEANSTLTRLVAKILFVAALYFVYALPVGWFISIALIVATTVLYLFSERALQSKMDLSAISILSKRFNDPQRAKNAALSTLQKMQQQNLSRRTENGMCRGYITLEGDNLLDLRNPRLSSRIAAIA